MQRVAFLGLGAIGTPMARRLLARGFDVAVFDVTPARMHDLVREGARESSSPSDAAQDADAAVVMVATPDQAVDAVFGQHGLAESLAPGKTLIVASTVGPGAVRGIDQRLVGKRVAVIDAPVSGGTARARTGELLSMASGEESAVAAARPILDAMASNVTWISSDVGDGQAMKLVNQLLCGVHLAAAGEALAFAEKLGLDRARAYNVVRQGAAHSFMLDDRAPRMLANGPVHVESALDIFVKDTDLVLAAAQEHGFLPDLAQTANRIFHAGSEAGMGSSDDSRVEAVYRMRDAPVDE